MKNHIYEKHDECNNPNCPICKGGLVNCVVCGGAKGSLTTECPGERILQKTLDAVYAGKMDYRSGQWVPLVKNSTAFGNRITFFIKLFTRTFIFAAILAAFGFLAEVLYLAIGNYEIAQKIGWIISPLLVGVSMAGMLLWILKSEFLKAKA